MGLVANHHFYLAARGYADKNPQIVQAIIDELARLDRWAEGYAKEVAVLLAPQIGLDAATTELAARRFAYGIQPINLAIAAEQQKIADAFFALKLIPKPLRISDVLPQALRTAAK